MHPATINLLHKLKLMSVALAMVLSVPISALPYKISKQTTVSSNFLQQRAREGRALPLLAIRPSSPFLCPRSHVFFRHAVVVASLSFSVPPSWRVRRGGYEPAIVAGAFLRFPTRHRGGYARHA